MPSFTFTSPAGKTYDVQGPEGATKEQAFQILQQRLGSPAGAAPAASGGAPAPASNPPAGQPPQSMTGFVGGNLAKGAADTVGSVAGKAQDLVDLPAKSFNKALDIVTGGKGKPPIKLPSTSEKLPVGEDALQSALKKMGVITQSAEPRTKAQKYGAAALQALPAAALPGAGETVLGRVLPQLGGALGGQAGEDIGGTPGRLAGTLLGGMGGGLAATRRGQISHPPQSEAARASESSGIPLTIGQETGSSTLQFLENRLRELFPSKGTANADEARQVAAGVRRVNELADQLSTHNIADPEAIGNRLRGAYNDAVGKIATARDTNASSDYGKVRALAGTKPVIKYQNVTDELSKIIEENKNVPAGDSKKIASQARTLLDQLTETPAAQSSSPIVLPSGQPARIAPPPVAGPTTAAVSDAMKTRSAWGKAARRTGNIFSDIDPNANQMLARRLFGAINKDFDAASTDNTPIAKALKDANQNYSKASKSIEFIEQSALGKLLGKDVTDAAYSGETFSTKAPEAIAKRYLSMEPSQAAQVTSILREHAPQVLQDAKSFVLRNGLEQAANTAPGASGISFSKFRREIDKVQPKLEEMGFSAKEIKDIKDVTDTMSRAGDRTGANPSGTTAAGHMLGTAAIALAHPVAAAASVVTPYVASKALLTESGRDLLRNAYAASTPAARNAAMGSLRALYGQSVTGSQQ
ncbi:hypothetical protein Q8F57_027235 [Paraburkholderia terrae]|uniref:hypothetical protein n=1 Tax=Paraburkholderia terrae TaxID=311230 RepID=UPI00296B200B|nr:hypothetical protein [Paraburkholderia terrae]MDW3660312.1 hypothetical protein [Paraburkholderia terrae]